MKKAFWIIILIVIIIAIGILFYNGQHKKIPTHFSNLKNQTTQLINSMRSNKKSDPSAINNSEPAMAPEIAKEQNPQNPTVENAANTQPGDELSGDDSLDAKQPEADNNNMNSAQSTATEVTTDNATATSNVQTDSSAKPELHTNQADEQQSSNPQESITTNAATPNKIDTNDETVNVAQQPSSNSQPQNKVTAVNTTPVAPQPQNNATSSKITVAAAQPQNASNTTTANDNHTSANSAMPLPGSNNNN
jgi:hypothetical protein